MTVAKATRKAAMGRSFLNVPGGGIIVVVFVGLGGRFGGTVGATGTPETFCVGFMLLHFLVSANKTKYYEFLNFQKKKHCFVNIPKF